VGRAVECPAKRRIELGKRPCKRRSTLKDAGPMNNLDEGSAEPEFYFVRRKGTVGLTYELGRTNFSYGDEAHLYLFEDLLSAIEQLHFFGLDPVRWDYATSSEFGGIASLVKIASKLPPPTPTHVAIPGQMVFAPFMGATIEHAIETFESSSWTEQWKSGRPKTPYWVLTDSTYQNFNVLTHVFAIRIHGVKAVCLFKTERDAEEFRHSGWVPANEWKSEGPVGSERGVRYLKEFPCYERSSHAVINPPPGSPGSIGSLRVTPIEVIIDNVEEKGHILDLD
jgi:hypothetical protein